jgi:hypothetical protein
MKSRGVILAGLVLAGAPLLAHAAPEVKNGAWEITFHEDSNGKQFSRTFKSCNRRAVTAVVMLKVMSEKGVCTRKAVTSSNTTVEVAVTCTAPMASQATFKYDAPDPETVNASEDEKRADGVTKHIQASAHWVGTCSHAG